MNRENSMSGELKALKVGSMLLYNNEFKNYGNLVLQSNRAEYKSEILINAIKRIKFLEQSYQYLQNLDYSKLFDAEIQWSNNNSREIKKLYVFVGDVYDAPSKRKACYLRLKKHINHFGTHHLFKNGTVARNICDDFDRYCEEKQIEKFSDKNELIDEYSTIKIGTLHGYKTKLSAAIQQKFLIDHAGDKSKQQSLKKLLLSKHKALDLFFSDSNVEKIQKLILSVPLSDIYKIYSQVKITDDDQDKLVDLFMSEEVSELIKCLKIIHNEYIAGLTFTKKEAITSAINVIKSKNQKEYYEDMADDLLLILTEYMWNGKFDYVNPKVFYYAVGNNLNGTLHKDFNNTTLSIFDEDGELISLADKAEGIAGEFRIPDELGGFHEIYAELLEPYQKKYAAEREKRRNIDVALLFLEDLGDYEKITRKAYGEFSDRTYANARQAKSTGKDIIITEIQVTRHDIKTTDLFAAVEVYSRKKNSDTI